jgi:hypothetical protein
MLVGCNPSKQPDSTISGVTTVSKGDLHAIRQAALDYIEGWFEGDVERMERSLHPDLAKRTIRHNRLYSISANEMIHYTQEGVGKKDGEHGHFIVTILDAHNNIAAVKIATDKYIDYLHIGKVNEKWRIINVLWTNNN